MCSSFVYKERSVALGYFRLRRACAVPIGLDDISKMPLVTDALLRRGHSPSVVEGILGANDLRLLKQSL
ncbi:MAG: membrane dipeptidase [Dehalococcoidia bacterium]